MMNNFMINLLFLTQPCKVLTKKSNYTSLNQTVVDQFAINLLEFFFVFSDKKEQKNPHSNTNNYCT